MKGSGGDLGSIKRDGFASLYMEKLIHLKKFIKGLTLKMKWLVTIQCAPLIIILEQQV